jgi:hypothetical protein
MFVQFDLVLNVLSNILNSVMQNNSYSPSVVVVVGVVVVGVAVVVVGSIVVAIVVAST